MLPVLKSRSMRVLQGLFAAHGRFRLANLLQVIVLLSLPVVLYALLPAQESGQAHITPRAQPTPAPPPVNNIVDPTLKTHTKPLKVDVNLVLVNVTITDPMNRIITGLEKENFRIFEGNNEQQIKHF